MDDSVGMHVINSRDELVHEIPGFFGSEFLALFNHLAHGLISYRERYFVLAQFQDDVDELGILEDRVELYDVAMVQGFVDFNL